MLLVVVVGEINRNRDGDGDGEVFKMCVVWCGYSMCEGCIRPSI